MMWQGGMNKYIWIFSYALFRLVVLLKTVCVMNALENSQRMEKWLGDGKWLGGVMVKEFLLQAW